MIGRCGALRFHLISLAGLHSAGAGAQTGLFPLANVIGHRHHTKRASRMLPLVLC